MGARWAWEARCPNGHCYGNFSGGADLCPTCNEEPEAVIDCEHWYRMENCNCREQIKTVHKIECTCVACTKHCSTCSCFKEA